ncbi:MAG: LysR substrate-binding domain-containing protein [Bdellovibrionota bacterium]
MTDLNEIAVFTRVASLGSFSKAAASLEMPVSTVSRKVSDLESRLGVTLIQRTTRKLNLTKSGEEFFKRCSDVLEGIEEAEARLSQNGGAPEGVLRVSVPVGMSTGRFPEFIADFLQKYSKVEIELLVTNQYVDLIAEKVDVAIRFGNLSDSSLVAKKLGADRRLLVASPSYLKARGTPKHPRELATHDCLVFQGRSSPTWVLIKDRSQIEVEVHGPARATDMQALRELAIRGLGITLIPEMSCIDAIASGELKAIMPEWKTESSGAYAVYPSRKFVPARLQVFLRELEAWKAPSWSR